jgi:CubicO group peptidase (beta-lactamase class C family)
MSNLKSITIAGFAVAALAHAQEVTAKVDELVHAYEQKNQFMGSVLVAKSGRVFVKKGYGMANLEVGVPNSPKTKFRIGSITKQFTATAILQLAAAGKLSVDDKISKYIPDSPATWNNITIHHLLTHTSGIFDYTHSPEYREGMRRTWTPLETLALVRNKPLDFEPGSKFSYSSSGYIALGYIVEKVSGEKYEDYLKKHIFDLLDMNDTGYDHEAAIIEHRAGGYTPVPGGKLQNAEYIDMSRPFAAGALYSTVEDLDPLGPLAVYGQGLGEGIAGQDVYAVLGQLRVRVVYEFPDEAQDAVARRRNQRIQYHHRSVPGRRRMRDRTEQHELTGDRQDRAGIGVDRIRRKIRFTLTSKLWLPYSAHASGAVFLL